MEYNIEELLVALAHRNRLALLKQIVDAGDNGLLISNATGSIPVQTGTISFHLNKMLKAKLLEVKESGRYRFYRINDEAIESLRFFLSTLDKKGI